MAQTRKQKRRRTFAAIGVAALLLALFLYLPRTRQVQLSGTCLEWQNNQPDHTVSRGFSLTGTYRWSPLGKTTLSGTLAIEGVTETWEYTDIYLPFDIGWSGDHTAPLMYCLEPPDIYTFADGWTVVLGRDLQSFAILCPPSLQLQTEPTPEDYADGFAVLWSAENSAVFSYPVENREQAVEQLRQLTENMEPAYSWN